METVEAVILTDNQFIPVLIKKDSCDTLLETLRTQKDNDNFVVFEGFSMAAIRPSRVIGVYFRTPINTQERVAAAIEKIANSESSGEDWKK